MTAGQSVSPSAQVDETVLAAAEILEMDLLDARPQLADPVLWIAIGHHVSRVEVDPHPLAVDFIDEKPGFARAEQELVPDVFQANGRPHFLGQGSRIAQRVPQPIPSLLIGTLDR